ncbi:GNAT family N-acetyltransferase [Granulicatella seriolae]|uniref:GNAT family N-acetyltransferase n=1 Tax=Granulicatella seriolae TaxID=2967226 RepID=A0ABT1WLK2_9LACT|nr:GNAT family N-acetyltransferase [Granulicatella seriolae]
MQYLETERLIIRLPKQDDFEILYKIHANPQTNVYNPSGPVKDMDEFQKTFDEWLTHHEKHRFGYYSLIDKEDNKVFGTCGLKFVLIKGVEFLNVYYRIDPSKSRRGFVKEAASAIIENVLAELDNNYQVVALTLDQNIPSRKTAESLGLVHNPELDNYEGKGNVYYFSNNEV